MCSCFTRHSASRTSAASHDNSISPCTFLGRRLAVYVRITRTSCRCTADDMTTLATCKTKKHMQIHMPRLVLTITSLILSCQLAKSSCGSPATPCHGRRAVAAPKSTRPSSRRPRHRSAGHHAILPHRHAAIFVGFSPTLHHDDGITPPPSASHRPKRQHRAVVHLLSGITPRLLATASHRRRGGIAPPSPPSGITPQPATSGISPPTASTSRRRPPPHMESTASPSSSPRID